MARATRLSPSHLDKRANGNDRPSSPERRWPTKLDTPKYIHHTQVFSATLIVRPHVRSTDCQRCRIRVCSNHRNTWGYDVNLQYNIHTFRSLSYRYQHSSPQSILSLTRTIWLTCCWLYDWQKRVWDYIANRKDPPTSWTTFANYKPSPTRELRRPWPSEGPDALEAKRLVCTGSTVDVAVVWRSTVHGKRTMSIDQQCFGFGLPPLATTWKIYSLGD